jgi:surfactin synthase thioesterase subunit
MGALLAFEVARRLEADGNPIGALFVSACPAPGRSGYDYIPESDRGLLDIVSELTGAAPEFLENEEFAARILPTLRGFRAIIDYRCPPDAVLSCPIFAFCGDNDEIATLEKVEPWSQRTAAGFAVRQFPGHHFYVNDNLPELVRDIEGRIASLCG